MQCDDSLKLPLSWTAGSQSHLSHPLGRQDQKLAQSIVCNLLTPLKKALKHMGEGSVSFWRLPLPHVPGGRGSSQDMVASAPFSHSLPCVYVTACVTFYTVLYNKLIHVNCFPELMSSSRPNPRRGLRSERRSLDSRRGSYGSESLTCRV